MAYQRRRYNSGGGNSSFLTRLLGANEAELNPENLSTVEEGPGSVPFQYSGNPEELLGQGGFVDPNTGLLVQQPFSGKQNFWSRMGGQPNKAEALNLEYQQAGVLGNQANRQAIDLAKAKLPIERQQVFEATAGRQGLTPEQLMTLSPDQLAALQAQAQASVATSGATKAKATTEQQIEDQTRRQKTRTSVNEGQVALNQSTARAGASGTKAGRDASAAKYMAQEYAPSMALQKMGDRTIGPGDLYMSQGVDNLFPGGAPSMFPPAGIGTGARTEQVEIPGQMIGNTGIRAEGTKINRSVPGQFRTPADPNIVSKVTGGSISAPSAGGQLGLKKSIEKTPDVTPSPIREQEQARSMGPDDIYNIPPHIAKQLEDPRYTPEAKQQILKQYYQSLINQAGPTLGDGISNFFGTSVDYNSKLLEQERLRKLLTPNY